MKMKKSVLAIAIALTAATGAANAAISAGGSPTDNGELFVTVWDPTASNQATFVTGLNLFTNTNGGKTAFDGTSSYTFNNLFSDPVFTTNFGSTQFGEQANWKWNVVAGSALPSNMETTMYTSISSSSQINNTAAAAGSQNIDSYLNKLGSCHTCGNTGTGNTSAVGPYGLSNNLNGLPISDAGTLGQSLYFFTATDDILNSFDPGADAVMAQSPYTWALSSNGTLTYNASSVAPVPVPAAVWLLGSALVGLVGVARRRETGGESEAALAV